MYLPIVLRQNKVMQELIFQQFNIMRGWGNGYVGVPREHPLYKVHYSEESIHINVHGGLTYSGFLRNEDEDYWYFGFDTHHWGDNPTNWSKDAVYKEAEHLAEQLLMEAIRLNIKE